MNGDIYFPGEEGSLDFRREQSLSTSLEINNFGVIAARDDDFGFDRDVWVRASKCVLNQQSLRSRELAAPRAEDNFPNHRGNLMRDTLQGKLLTCRYSSEGRSGFSAREGCSVVCERRFNPREIESKNSAT